MERFFFINLLAFDIITIAEIRANLKKCLKEHLSPDNRWTINDLCIVRDNNDYYRGRIVAVNEDTYHVKLIDYGNILQNLTVDYLYVLPKKKEIFDDAPLARKCQLYGVDDVNQSTAIDRDVAKRKKWGVQEKFFQNFRVY